MTALLGVVAILMVVALVAFAAWVYLTYEDLPPADGWPEDETEDEP